MSCSPVELLGRLDLPVAIVGFDGTVRDAAPAAAQLLQRLELGPWIVDCVLEHGSWQGQVEQFEVRATRLADAVAVAFFPGAGENLRATIDSLSAHVAVINEEGVVVAVNTAWREFALGNGARSDFIGANYLEVCDAAREEEVARQLRELLSAERESVELEYPCDERWFAIRGMPYASDGRRWAIVIHLDITDRRRVRERAFLQAALLDELDTAVIATDLDHRIISWNAGAEQLFGWSAREAIGRSVDELALTPSSYVDPAIGARLAGGRWDGECTAQRKEGTSFPAYFRINAVGDAVVWVAMDISQRRESEHQLQLARDYLRAIIDGIGHGMCTLDEAGRVTYMNGVAQDLLGWSFEELQGRVAHDVLHRSIDGPSYSREDCPVHNARREGEVLRVEDDTFLRADGTELPVAYTAAPFSGRDGAGGTVVVFEDISERQAQTRQMEHDLEQLATIKRIRGALNDDGFVLHAQPIIDLGSGETVQRELLIRMRDPDSDGVLGPGTFLPAAEEYGFIADIDRWVIGRSAEIAATGLAVELNISAASLGDPGLIEFIADAIEHTGADPTRMVFEITETTLVSDQAAGRQFVSALHELGCKVALDDFGTGYGGFTYLKQLPIDYLKIDIEFVRDLAHSMASRKVVEAIVNLAHGFELQTVAEGVEDEETLALLRRLGVDYAQGYHLGRPAPLEI